MAKGLIINTLDNVATMLESVHKGEKVLVEKHDQELTIEIEALNDIPQWHKVALLNIESAQHIIKYGEVIAIAIRDIQKGEHVHIHNSESQRGRGDILRGE